MDRRREDSSRGSGGHDRSREYGERRTSTRDDYDSDRRTSNRRDDYDYGYDADRKSRRGYDYYDSSDRKSRDDRSRVNRSRSPRRRSQSPVNSAAVSDKLPTASKGPEPPEIEELDEDAQLAAFLGSGISTFASTKGQKVRGNQFAEAADVVGKKQKKQREYRQYLYVKGSYDIPLTRDQVEGDDNTDRRGKAGGDKNHGHTSHSRHNK